MVFRISHWGTLRNEWRKLKRFSRVWKDAEPYDSLEGSSKAVGKTIGELKVGMKMSVSIIAITHEGYVAVSPGPDTVIHEADVLALLGSPQKIDEALIMVSDHRERRSRSLAR